MNKFSLISLVVLLIAGSSIAPAQEPVRQSWLKLMTGSPNGTYMQFRWFDVNGVGLITGSLRAATTSGNYQEEILRLSTDGAVLWGRTERNAVGIATARDGDALIDAFPFLVAYDTEGNERFRTEELYHRTWTYSDQANALFAERLGNVERHSTANGARIWSYKDPESTPYYDRLFQADANGNTYLGGADNETFGVTKSRLLKLSPTGSLEFSYKPAPAGYPMDVDWYEGDTYYLDIGWSNERASSRITRLDPIGQVLWSRTIPDHVASAFTVDGRNGRVYVIGRQYVPNLMATNLTLTALDDKGTILWHQVHEELSIPGHKIIVDSFGRVYAAHVHYIGHEQARARVRAMNPDGSVIWSSTMQINPETLLTHIDLDDKFNFYWGGFTTPVHTTSARVWIAKLRQSAFAVNDSYVLSTNPLTVAAPGVLRNDAYAQGAKPVIARPPANGTLQFATDGGFTYTANPGFAGTDTFTYYLDNGLKSNTATVSIRVDVNWLKSLSLSNANLIGGDATNAIISLTKAATAPTSVALSSNSSAIQVPASATVAAGSQTAVIQVKTSPVSTTVTRTVTASRDGVSKVASLTLAPGGLKSNAISPSSITGGNAATATVSLSGPAPAGGRTVTLTSNSSSVVVPSSVTIPQGASTATYAVQTSPLAQPVTRQVTARLGTISITANLTILPAKLSRLTISPSTVKGGTSTTGTVALTGKTAANLTVNLSSNSSVVVVPASVIVAAGTTSKTFTITTRPVSATATRQVTATQAGVTSTANITLTP